MIRDYVTANQLSQVERILEILNDLARSQNPHNRKGGLIGLAAAAIALGKVFVSLFKLFECFSRKSI